VNTASGIASLLGADEVIHSEKRTVSLSHAMPMAFKFFGALENTS
jgi:hypothetical protein